MQIFLVTIFLVLFKPSLTSAITSTSTLIIISPSNQLHHLSTPAADSTKLSDLHIDEAVRADPDPLFLSSIICNSLECSNFSSRPNTHNYDTDDDDPKSPSSSPFPSSTISPSNSKISTLASNIKTNSLIQQQSIQPTNPSTSTSNSTSRLKPSNGATYLWGTFLFTLMLCTESLRLIPGSMKGMRSRYRSRSPSPRSRNGRWTRTTRRRRSGTPSPAARRKRVMESKP